MPLSVRSVERAIGLSIDVVTKRLSELTPRETEVVNLFTDGLEPRQIAAKLGMSPKTVDVHRGNIKRKFGAKTTVDLARYVITKRLAEAISK
jgi:two-component system response regulator FixJ